MLPKIIQEYANILEVPICVAEIAEALDALKPNKSPGSVGLTAEFYKKIVTFIAYMRGLFIALLN